VTYWLNDVTVGHIAGVQPLPVNSWKWDPRRTTGPNDGATLHGLLGLKLCDGRWN